MKYFQSGGGDEYMSIVFKKYFDSHGIIHLISCPHTPQQNGIVERKHRHIIETVVTLLSTTSLPP